MTKAKTKKTPAVRSRPLTKKQMALLEKKDPKRFAKLKAIDAKIEAIRESGRAKDEAGRAAVAALVEPAIPALRAALAKILPEATFIQLHVATAAGFGSPVLLVGDNHKPAA